MSWFTVLRLLLYRSVLELFSKSFKVFHCSVINVRCCYSQQLVYFIISSSRCQQLFYFFFVVVLSRTLWYLIMSVAFCQQLFESFYLIQSGEGGIWTLAPLLTTCTLSRGVPSASLGTSPYSCSNHFLSREVMILTQKKNSFEFFFKRLNRLAERMGFEPMCPCGQTVFKTASLWPLRYLSVFCFRCSSESAQDIYYHPRLFMSITIFHFFCFFQKNFCN